jgi:acyl CoA:acetate/3-ketoacid CoA transferase beta subunit
VLNHRNFPRSTMLGDAGLVLGTLVGGPGTTTVACLGGAQVDRFGNINSTHLPGGPFLVGSGGGNDVASVAAEALVVATLTQARTPPECGYVTSPGRAVRALVTDLGVLEKRDGDELVLTAVPAGDGTADEQIDAARTACGWDLAVAPDVRELAPPNADEIAALRHWDPRGWFLRDR